MPRRTTPPSGKGSAGRAPTREELLIWKQVTAQDQRLPGAEIRLPEPPASDAGPPPVSRASDDQLDSLLRKQAFDMAGAAHAERQVKPPAKGGVDGNTVRRLRQGKLPVEATLDLHGMYREEARHALSGFLQRAHESGKRCVLVITGKGRFIAQDDRRDSGVLRRELPRWLAQPPIAPWVLRHETAQPHHGGEGAVYILLRRRR